MMTAQELCLMSRGLYLPHFRPQALFLMFNRNDSSSWITRRNAQHYALRQLGPRRTQQSGSKSGAPVQISHFRL